MGLRALFDAWILVLRGQEDQLPPFYGFDVDLVANLGDSPVEPHVLADRQLKGLSFFVFVVRYVFGGEKMNSVLCAYCPHIFNKWSRPPCTNL
jgi:hypothetical protein